MRRQYQKSESEDPFISWLRSVGCLIYLPLSEGDLQDKITGNYLTLSGDGSLVWDSTEQMYLCTTPSSYGQYVASLPFPYDYADFSEDQFTKAWAYKRVSTRGQFCSASYITSATSPVVLMGAYKSTMNLPQWDSNKNYWLMIEGSTRYTYLNWAQTSSSSVYSPNLPSAWADSASTLYFGVGYNSNTYSKQVYMSDIMYFGRALTTTEMATLQNWMTSA